MGDSDTEITPGANTTPLADTKDLSDIFQDPSAEQEAFLSVLDLNTSHIRAYVAVVENPNSKVDSIAGELDRHRRYVAKSLRTLYDTGLVDREKSTFDSGGVGYVYWPVSVETVQSHFHLKLHKWATDARTELAKVDRRIESDTTSLCDSQKRGRE